MYHPILILMLQERLMLPCISKQVLGIDCPGCGVCLELGCPAIEELDGQSVIDPAVCTGCGLCTQICPFCGLKVDSIRRDPVIA